MKKLAIITLLILSSCTYGNMKMYDAEKLKGADFDTSAIVPYCDVQYLSVMKDFNSPSLKLCGAVVGADTSTVTEVDVAWLNAVLAGMEKYLNAQGVPVF